MGIRPRLLLLLMLAVIPAALIPTPASAGPVVTQVASGLDNPRGIAFSGGRMLVAEAGHGGTNCFTPPQSFTICVGDTSQISWVNPTNGTHSALVSGLFSISLGPEGVIGVSGLSVHGTKILGQIGGTPQELPDGFTMAKAQAGHLISVTPGGTWSSVASVGETNFNYTLPFPEPAQGPPFSQSPGTQEHDANPYGVLATEDGAYVADAGANTLDFVSNQGAIHILHHFDWRSPVPNFPSDAVPTCVARTEDTLWVGQLSGQLFRVDESGVHQVTPVDHAGRPVLTHVTGCTADREGNLYFVNMFGNGIPFQPGPFFNGTVVKYNADEETAVVLADHIFAPNMPAIGRDGNLYVTAGSLCDSVGHFPGPPPAPPENMNPCHGGGKVLRINLHQEGENHGGDN